MMPLARKLILDRADRLQRVAIPTGDLDRIADRLRRQRVEVIDLSRWPSPADAELSVASMASRLGLDGWRDATDDDLAALAEATAGWYNRRFGVTVNPESEVAVVPNAVVGLHLVSLGFVEPGCGALIPDPGAPYYRSALVLAGGETVPYALWERNDYLPNFAAMEQSAPESTRLLVIAYPHNPTSAAADLPALAQAVAFARRRRMLVVADGALSFATAGAFHPRSFLETRGAKGVGVVLCDLGQSFGCADLSVAVVVGNRDAVAAVRFLMSQARLRPSRGVVSVALGLFEHAEEILAGRIGRLEVSRELLVESMARLRWTPRSSPIAPFLWISLPRAANSEAFCRRLLRRTGILLAPGTAFGERGEGYVRMTIPEDLTVARTVAERLQRHAKLYQPPLPRRRILRHRRLRGDSAARRPLRESE